MAQYHRLHGLQIPQKVCTSRQPVQESSTCLPAPLGTEHRFCPVCRKCPFLAAPHLRVRLSCGRVFPPLFGVTARLPIPVAPRSYDQVELREVGPADRAAHDHLASLRPDSISWSNVPDYMEPAGFHAMARACSAPAAPPPAPSAAASSSSTKSNSKGGSSSCSGNGGRGGGKPTRHYLHSMNWVMDVKGACHLDELMPYIYGQGGTAGRRGGGRQGRGEVNEEAGKVGAVLLHWCCRCRDALERCEACNGQLSEARMCTEQRFCIVLPVYPCAGAWVQQEGTYTIASVVRMSRAC